MAKSMSMHSGFYFFPEIVPDAPTNLDRTLLEPVQIQERLLMNALNIFSPLRASANNVQRILNLAIDADPLDFHLTFRLEASTDKIQPDVHFAIRNEAEGHNAVLYWWYQLNAIPGDKKLYWLWTGCAGQGDAHSIAQAKSYKPFIQHGTTAESILKRLLQRFETPSTKLERHLKSKKLTLS